MKGWFAEVQRGSQDHQRAGKHPETSSSGKLSRLFPPLGLEKLDKQLGLSKSSGLGRDPKEQKAGPTTSVTLAPHEERWDINMPASPSCHLCRYLLRADFSENEGDGNSRRGQPPRTQSGAENESARAG